MPPLVNVRAFHGAGDLLRAGRRPAVGFGTGHDPSLIGLNSTPLDGAVASGISEASATAASRSSASIR